MLANKLIESKTHLVRTLRVNRKHLPPGVKNAKLKPGDVKAAENRDGIIVALKWKHKRDVLLLSTKHTTAWGALQRGPGGPWPTQNFGWVGHNAFGPTNNWPVCSLVKLV